MKFQTIKALIIWILILGGVCALAFYYAEQERNYPHPPSKDSGGLIIIPFPGGPIPLPL